MHLKEDYKKNANDNKTYLCCDCETGIKMLQVDAHEPMCPYLIYHNGTTCVKYKSANIKKIENEVTKK